MCFHTEKDSLKLCTMPIFVVLLCKHGNSIEKVEHLFPKPHKCGFVTMFVQREFHVCIFGLSYKCLRLMMFNMYKFKKKTMKCCDKPLNELSLRFANNRQKPNQFYSAFIEKYYLNESVFRKMNIFGHISQSFKRNHFS